MSRMDGAMKRRSALGVEKHATGLASFSLCGTASEFLTMWSAPSTHDLNIVQAPEFERPVRAA